MQALERLRLGPAHRLCERRKVARDGDVVHVRLEIGVPKLAEGRRVHKDDAVGGEELPHAVGTPDTVDGEDVAPRRELLREGEVVPLERRVRGVEPRLLRPPQRSADAPLRAARVARRAARHRGELHVRHRARRGIPRERPHELDPLNAREGAAERHQRKLPPQPSLAPLLKGGRWRRRTGIHLAPDGVRARDEDGPARGGSAEHRRARRARPKDRRREALQDAAR
mmetsp:Transcript_14326/g.47058  ORF Transcript_14326/g.47058 Transcript_14326/m.47058 type:complete len:226 (-) Transcript_14326:2-679(-)